MKYFIKILMSLLVLLGISSCNENKQFQEELYKNVFAIVSSDSYNVFEKEHNLDEAESTGYISISMGGTNPTTKDTKITLVQDLDLFNRYNKGTYDVETEKYANLLSPGKYTIDSYNLTVPAGQREVRLPIKIRPEGLSPDSTYMISLKIAEYSDYEVNPDKSDVLYRVYIKNYYAAQKSQTNYNMKGSLDGGNILGTKRVFPLKGNSIRIIAGNQGFEADTAIINKWSIAVEVAGNGHATIKPFRNNRIQVEQIDDDPNYPNKFFIEDDGFRTFKSFLLHYKFKVEGDNNIHESREELRLEFNEENE
ncbi:MAG: DUF1735 domain-containing protein [Prevotellaceae bacterium]|jgi:hypothetical protein|nr:DUF1735 domain-containing protein [Prevotellaceae bacterium]